MGLTISKKPTLKEIKEELEIITESLEFVSDPEFMKSYRRAKKQIAERDFADWDELQNYSD